MGDFDDALERLLADPNFALSLASDPSAALAGYHLSAEEMELLSAQISRDAETDGRADFAGHDYDRDGLADAVDDDKNLDGRDDLRKRLGR